MKDITIKGSVLKKELIVWLICFAIANLVNIFAIISRDTQWKELITMMHIVILLSILFYGIAWLGRLIVRLGLDAK